MTENKANSDSFWTKLMKILTWKIVVIYVSLSLIVYSLIKDLVEPMGLPNWTLSFIVVFIIACFPAIVLFSVIIDSSRLGKKNKESNSDVKEEKVVDESFERRFKIVDVFLIITVIVSVLFLIFYKLL